MYHKTLYGYHPRFAQRRFGRTFSTVAAVNILENDNAYELSLMAPGRNKEDFRINLRENILTVSYEQKEETEQKQWLRNEFHLSSFERSFELNEKVDASAISARYENGILQLTLPKKENAHTTTLEIAVA